MSRALYGDTIATDPTGTCILWWRIAANQEIEAKCRARGHHDIADTYRAESDQYAARILAILTAQTAQ